MATWFIVVSRVLQVEGIPDSVYKNALCEFEKGERNSRDGEIRTFYIAFNGDLLQNGQSYIILGNSRLPANSECKDPKVSIFTVGENELRAITIFAELRTPKLNPQRQSANANCEV
jgi:hypothetical protein